MLLEDEGNECGLFYVRASLLVLIKIVGDLENLITIQGKSLTIIKINQQNPIPFWDYFRPTSITKILEALPNS